MNFAGPFGVQCKSCGVEAHVMFIDGWEGHLRNRGWMIQGQVRYCAEGIFGLNNLRSLFPFEERADFTYCPTCTQYEVGERMSEVNSVEV